MSAGGARRGRRDNGFDAAEYAVAGDVDPRVGEHLLDVLAAGRIAAYLQPSADLNPVTRTTTVPPRPTDRLYVDRTHLETARGYLAQLAEEIAPVAAGASRGEPDVDLEWAKIVAGYDATLEDNARPWPAAEDVTAEETADDAEGPEPDDPNTGSASRPAQESAGPATSGIRRLPSAVDISGISVGRRGDDPSLLDGLDSFGAELPDDSDERYIPPPPPPLPRLSKYSVVAVIAMTAGFVLFLFPSLLPVGRTVVTMIGFIAILGGFVTLIWRLRPDDEEDDDPDDGAVV